MAPQKYIEAEQAEYVRALELHLAADQKPSGGGNTPVTPPQQGSTGELPTLNMFQKLDLRKLQAGSETIDSIRESIKKGRGSPMAPKKYTDAEQAEYVRALELHLAADQKP